MKSLLYLFIRQFESKVDGIFIMSKKIRGTSRNLSSTDLASLSRQSTNSSFSGLMPLNNLQNAIIASKLSEVHVWGGGKLTPKLLEMFRNELAAQKVAAGPSHFAVITVERELFTWAVC